MPIQYFDFKIKTIEDLSLKGKRVFIRCDFNVPLDAERNILDDTRIKATLPTIQYAISEGAHIILASHLGRPQGVPTKEFSLEPVGARLSQLLGQDVILADDCIGEAVIKVVDELNPGEIVLLENLRFNSAEKKNNPTFAHHLARIIDVYVNDAFGVCHRSDASVDALPKLIKERGCGLLVQKEIENLTRVLEHPERPYVAIIGGAKVSDKIELLRNLIIKVDALLVGGALSYTLLRSQGVDVGASLVEENKMSFAHNLLEKAKIQHAKFILPVDHVISKSFKIADDMQVTKNEKIRESYYGVDIGPKTVEKFLKLIRQAKTIVWNGPLGIYEVQEFSQGTKQVAEAVAGSRAFTVVGGGDCVAAVNGLGLANKISHISTGGGASIEYLEGKILPGLQVLTI
ncbi:MAG TPA: phosphoglycerate kinase [Bdellovibrionota bacterium]|nr:phosphoglycerate kinase [Bdellovibrionota bacterium]